MAAVKYLDENGLSTVWSKVKGIVTPKADKVSGATAGHLAGLNSSGNLTDSGLVATNVAQKDGSYSGMTVGAAEDLVSAESVASEFTSRITGGSTAVGKGGTALVDKIKGRTLVWNQLVKQSYGSTVTPNEVTITVADDGKFTLSGTASASGGRTSYVSSTSSRIPIISGHKYLSVNGAPSTLAPYVTLPSSTSTLFQTPNGIINTASTTFEGRLGFNVTKDINYDGVSFYLSLFDLTLMFGAGNEPATAEEFEALYPGPYYDYNPGTLISNAASAIETVGWNIWDEEWEVGSINENGVPATSSTVIRSKNFCRMQSNTVYYATAGGRVDYLVIYFYDANYNLIPYTGAGAYANGYNGTSTTFTSPVGTAYFKFRTSTVYGPVYKNDIMFNLPDPSRNGTYEPYWRSELELGLGDIKVKSHNVWDEEWRQGYYSSANGEYVSGDSRYPNHFANNTRIRALANTTYYATPSSIWIGCYADDNSYLGNISASSHVFTTLSGTAYINFYVPSYGQSYANDICINLSDPAFDGRYEPYGDGGVITLTGGLKSAGTVYDEISGGKLIKRVDSYDLSGRSWGYSTSTTNPRFTLATGVSCVEAFAVNNRYINYDSYITLVSTSSSDKGVFLAGSGNLSIVDKSFSDATTFGTSMSGVILYYALATPIEYELADALPTAMRNDPYGTERRLPEDTAAIVTAPFRADITYSTNIKEAVQSLPQNYINVNSMQDFLAALGAQMGGTWTMRPADGKFDFTFTPNPETE